jgi:predicted transcriptional regulator
MRLLCYNKRMATDTLSVRLSPKARETLDAVARDRKIPGASALARELLERWADREQSARTAGGVARVIEAATRGELWTDDPADFFPGIHTK